VIDGFEFKYSPLRGASLTLGPSLEFIEAFEILLEYKVRDRDTGKAESLTTKVTVFLPDTEDHLLYHIQGLLDLAALHEVRETTYHSGIRIWDPHTIIVRK
jgi:hypothetical protein